MTLQMIKHCAHKLTKIADRPKPSQVGQWSLRIRLIIVMQRSQGKLVVQILARCFLEAIPVCRVVRNRLSCLDTRNCLLLHMALKERQIH
jgi:hypothetical protein